MNHTNVYLPYLNFKLDEKNGEKTLIEYFMANGPTDNIVVHDNEEWRRIKDNKLIGDWIDIIEEKEMEEARMEALKFFAPLYEGIPYVTDGNDNKLAPNMLVRQCSRMLSYIILSHKHNAWIYCKNLIIECNNELRNIKNQAEYLSEEGIERIGYFDNFINSYHFDEIKQLTVAEDAKTFDKFYDAFDDAMISQLSNTNYNFGVLKYRFDKLKRDVNYYVTEICNSEETSYFIEGCGTLASVLLKREEIEMLTKIISYLSKYLRGVDLNEYAPPIKQEDWFWTNYAKLFELKYFNDVLTIKIPK